MKCFATSMLIATLTLVGCKGAEEIEIVGKDKAAIEVSLNYAASKMSDKDAQQLNASYQFILHDFESKPAAFIDLDNRLSYNLSGATPSEIAERAEEYRLAPRFDGSSGDNLDQSLLVVLEHASRSDQEQIKLFYSQVFQGLIQHTQQNRAPLLRVELEALRQEFARIIGGLTGKELIRFGETFYAQES